MACSGGCGPIGALGGKGRGRDGLPDLALKGMLGTVSYPNDRILCTTTSCRESFLNTLTVMTWWKEECLSARSFLEFSSGPGLEGLLGIDPHAAGLTVIRLSPKGGRGWPFQDALPWEPFDHPRSPKGSRTLYNRQS